ncbi:MULTISPECIES: hypothetical protein [Halobacterium]|uniref:hypothetical protein n=1 Tax=Halobacterium TaxID=2239 RepID=UPI00073E1B36|nr:MULTISPECIES: hypothetical protein [Halobacterium]MCG1004014.1 hypothetical protein [Halobacterium noricense]
MQPTTAYVITSESGGVADKRPVPAWTPSALYFLMVVPAVAPLVAAAYVYRRHQHVGVPANPLADSR